ncbi:MAG: hypothetical protein UW70_C0044G0015 [Candidatus Peregrinibacteria bacterium GW2011_GWA2_44_7]|nr:MAG: hypothetical protein UW70_C0044G0015 [Candidatus Peregrinibacteria bacterium GW2011_GWA2_44_7]
MRYGEVEFFEGNAAVGNFTPKKEPPGWVALRGGKLKRLASLHYVVAELPVPAVRTVLTMAKESKMTMIPTRA